MSNTACQTLSFRRSRSRYRRTASLTLLLVHVLVSLRYHVTLGVAVLDCVHVRAAVIRGIGSSLTLVRQIPSSSLPSPSLYFRIPPLEVGALNPASGSEAEPQRESNLVHFSIKNLTSDGINSTRINSRSRKLI